MGLPSAAVPGSIPGLGGGCQSATTQILANLSPGQDCALPQTQILVVSTATQQTSQGPPVCLLLGPQPPQMTEQGVPDPAGGAGSQAMWPDR